MPNPFVGHHSAQAIGAKKQGLTRSQPLLEQVSLHLGLITDHAIDDISLGMMNCFLSRDLTCNDETLD